MLYSVHRVACGKRFYWRQGASHTLALSFSAPRFHPDEIRQVTGNVVLDFGLLTNSDARDSALSDIGGNSIAVITPRLTYIWARVESTDWKRLQGLLAHDFALTQLTQRSHGYHAPGRIHYSAGRVAFRNYAQHEDKSG